MFRFIAQDRKGWICMFPRDVDDLQFDGEWSMALIGDDNVEGSILMEGRPNDNWRDTKIDLAVDNFKIEGGILTRTTLKANPEPIPAQAPLPEGTHDHTEMRAAWEARGKPFDIEYWTHVGGWAKIRHPSWQATLKYRVAEAV